MKYLLIVFASVLQIFNTQAQVVNSNNSMVLNPGSSDPRVGFTFYSKGLMTGILEPRTKLMNIRNNFSILFC